MLAPIAGVVYLAGPAVGYATYRSTRAQSPFRHGLIVASGLFLAGALVFGAGAAVSLWAFGNGRFAAQELGSGLAFFGLLIVPFGGLLVGGVSLIGALVRPGVGKPVRPQPVGGLEDPEPSS
ncbi:MAG: hypothetical protein Q8K99_11170 [Actinomycetota bacterium]|nr:hypothetical protein [Actinomycetota bacterium]